MPDQQPLSRVDFNLFNVFDVVMTERHVTRAAERLDMTQAAVSNALNRLRRQFQDQLFVKAARGVDPTPRAMELWPRIHKALVELRGTVNPPDVDVANLEQRFRIAMVDISVLLFTSHLYRRVHELSPHASLFFVPHDPALTGARLMRGEVDFAISIDLPRAAVLQSMPLFSDRLVVAARHGHPLLERKLSLADFCEAPQLAINAAGHEDAPSLIDDALASLELKRNVCLSLNHYSVVTKILRDSDLIAVLPERFATTPDARKEVQVRPLPLDVPNAVLHLSWHQRSNNLPAHQWMKQRLLEAARAFV
ncbi:LysR family transcriptional regulator [Pseudomonas sp. GCM10022188]|uniref:LysR family transcriptional regulator n=1 Tax=Pseudomonas TaxID=286 RepID=UPI001E39FE99|nr:LysR family transcriptional regulator [Pseudomonas oryzagri]MCC6076069.1 LysR family transcriptional regulator [Pseudomonas oryzagri]